MGLAPEAASAGDLPQYIGRYRIIERLGKGAMGMVYAADDSAMGRRVAVKVMMAEAQTLDAKLDLVDARSDVFSATGVFYFMLTGLELALPDTDLACDTAAAHVAARFPLFAQHADPASLMEPLDRAVASSALAALQTRHNTELGTLAALRARVAAWWHRLKTPDGESR